MRKHLMIESLIYEQKDIRSPNFGFFLARLIYRSQESLKANSGFVEVAGGGLVFVPNREPEKSELRVIIMILLWLIVIKFSVLPWRILRADTVL
jgi:hypothetical protein